MENNSEITKMKNTLDVMLCMGTLMSEGKTKQEFITYKILVDTIVKLDDFTSKIISRSQNLSSEDLTKIGEFGREIATTIEGFQSTIEVLKD